MTEQNKQPKNQEDKSIKQQPQKTDKKQPDTKSQHATSSTDPASVDDKQYIERIEEKTEKH